MGFDAGLRHSLRKKPGDSLSTYGAHATGSPQWVAATQPSQVLKKKKSDCAVPSGPPCDRGVTLPRSYVDFNLDNPLKHSSPFL